MAKTYRPGRSQTDGQLGLVRHLGTGEYNDDIYIATAAKPDGWNLGDRRQLQDGRTFYLSRAYAAPIGHVHCDYGRTMQARNAKVSYTTTNCLGGAKGSHTISVIGSTIAEGVYAGGFMYLTDATNAGTRKTGRKIISNTASATVGGVANTVAITLDGPLPTTYGTSDSVYVVPNMYAYCHEGDGLGNASYLLALTIGVLVVTGKVAADDYVWLQTWGEHAWLGAAATNEGGVYFERPIYAMGDGSIQAGISGQSTVGGEEAAAKQRIGWLLPKTSFSADIDSFYFLTINP